MADYYTLLTNAGIAYETACKAAGTPIKLTQISVGDGGGTVYNPAATATALKREVWRGPLNALFQDEKNPSWLLAEVTIPPDVGGWYVREAGLWTDTGVLYAIVKYPESFKPVLATSGSGKEFYIRSIFETSNAALVTLLIDDTVVKATRAWVMSYLAEELGKLDGKQSVRVAATANVVMKGAQQIDGVAVIAGDRVLLPNQTLAKDNGLWIVANGDWVRAIDANVSAKVTPGLTVMVEEGTANGDSLWHLTTNAPITLGTSALTFEMLAGRTGILAGTYKSLTVDKYGRATAGSNPESLAGFGIKDSYTKAEVDALIAKASALPVGSIVAFPVDSPPPGFFELDNSVKSSATYPDLSAYLGGKFNKGDEGVGNFRLPETRGEFLRGWDHGRGVDAGRGVGSWQADDNKSHIHGTTYDVIADIFMAGDVRRNYLQQYNGTDDVVTKASGGAEARPRNIAVMWCIKAWSAPINQGNIDIAALAEELQQYSLSGPIAGNIRNGRVSITVASSSSTFTASEIVLGDVNGRKFVISDFNQTINLASALKGVGAMDVGGAPVNGFVASYALYNPASNATAIIAVNGTTKLAPNLFSGVAPDGYTFSALIGILPTNASGQFAVAEQVDQRVFYGTQVVSTTVPALTLTGLSISTAVPLNAKSVSGNFQGTVSANGYSLGLAGSAAAIGLQTFIVNFSGAGGGSFLDVPLLSPQTLFYRITSAGNFSAFAVTTNSYRF